MNALSYGHRNDFTPSLHKAVLLRSESRPYVIWLGGKNTGVNIVLEKIGLDKHEIYTDPESTARFAMPRARETHTPPQTQKWEILFCCIFIDEPLRQRLVRMLLRVSCVCYMYVMRIV